MCTNVPVVSGVGRAVFARVFGRVGAAFGREQFSFAARTSALRANGGIFPGLFLQVFQRKIATGVANLLARQTRVTGAN